MNESPDPLESRLRSAPAPRPPAELRDRLHADIPGTRASVAPPPHRTAPGFWQRWWPVALPGLASLALASVVVIQHQEIQALTAHSSPPPAPSAAPARTTSAGSLPGTPGPNPGSQAPSDADPRAELERLRARVKELTESLARLEALQRDLPRMEAERATQAAAASPELREVYQTRDRVLRITCVNNLKQLGLAARLFATDHNDEFPPDLAQFLPYLGTPFKVFVCPVDETRPIAADAASFTMAHTSYELLAPGPGKLESEPNRVLMRCPIHGSVALCDGSVQQLDADQQRRLVRRDGKLFLENQAPVAPAPQP
jgi:hypothetical protein